MICQLPWAILSLGFLIRSLVTDHSSLGGQQSDVIVSYSVLRTYCASKALPYHLISSYETFVRWLLLTLFYR